MLTNSATLLICTVVLVASSVTLLSTNALNLVLLSEYTNFLVFPLLVFLATTTNGPYNLLLIVPLVVFSAIETVFAGIIIFYNTKS